MNFKLLFDIVRARFLLILGTLVIAVVIAGVLTAMEPKRYRGGHLPGTELPGGRSVR